MKTLTNNLSPAPRLLYPWFIWGLAALFYAYEFFLQVSPSVMVPDLMHAFRVNAATLGNLAAFYFYAYASMQIPAGLFLDTLGPRRLLATASFICATGSLLFAASHVLWAAQLGRLLIGLGSAFAAIGTFKLAAAWFPLRRFAFISGLTVAIGMLGAVIGGAPLAMVVDALGWRNSMLLLGLAGICICLLIWIFVRDYPPSDKVRTTSREKFIPSLLYIFKQPQSWITAIYGGLMFAPTSAFAALWGVPFLMTKYDFQRPVAAGAVSMIFIGWAVGSPLFGWISDYMQRRKPTLILGAAGALICMLMIIYTSVPLLTLYIILFLFGFLSAGFLPSFSIIREINLPHMNATALGFMNMLNMVGGAVLQPLIGYILDHYWTGLMDGHARIYSDYAYHIALSLLPIILLMALLLAFFIRETHCTQIYKEAPVLS